MATERVSMRSVREIFRQKWVLAEVGPEEKPPTSGAKPRNQPRVGRQHDGAGPGAGLKLGRGGAFE